MIDAVTSLVGLSVGTILVSLGVVVLVWGAIAYWLERDVTRAADRTTRGIGGIIAGAAAVLVVAGEALADIGSDVFLLAPNFIAELAIVGIAYGAIEGVLPLSGEQFVAIAAIVVVVVGLMRFS